jgi:phosphopantothenoylcysteine decarboxylase/phosphopantothenate--cysteine ligase
MAAAVADYKPKDIIKEKVDKKGTLNLQLVATADIISTISGFKKKPLIVGFAAETGDKKDRAREKLNRKNMDMVVFNDVSLNGSGFDVDTNIITLIGKDTERDYPKMDKDEVASVILDKISDMLS